MVFSPTIALIGKTVMKSGGLAKFTIGLVLANKIKSITFLVILIALLTSIGAAWQEQSLDPIKDEGTKYLRIDAFLYDQVQFISENNYLTSYSFKEKLSFYWMLFSKAWIYFIYLYVIWWVFNDSPIAPNTSARFKWLIITVIFILVAQGALNYQSVKDKEVASVSEYTWEIFPLKGLISFVIHFPDIIRPIYYSGEVQSMIENPFNNT